MSSRRCKPKDHAEYSRSKPCIAAKAARSCPGGVDTVEKGFWGGCLSNIDSRSSARAQSRFKNPFVRIRLFQILIPQLHFGDFFNTIGQTEKSRQRDGTAGLPSTTDIFGHCRDGR